MEVDFLIINTLISHSWVIFVTANLILAAYVGLLSKVFLNKTFVSTMFLLYVALICFSMGSGRAGVKFSVTDESGFVQDIESEVKDNSPERMSDSERLDYNKKAYEENN